MRILLPAIVPGLLLSATGARAALEFSSLTGSSIVFAGNGISQFNFTGALDDQWKITTPGSAENLRGRFEADAWSYGPITSLPGGVQEATVTGPEGTFSLADGTGHFATGYVNWGQLDTYRTSGGLNAGASINLTGMKYDGLNCALLDLVSSGDGSLNLTFHFDAVENLTDLTCGDGGRSRSYWSRCQSRNLRLVFSGRCCCFRWWQPAGAGSPVGVESPSNGVRTSGGLDGPLL